MAGRWDKALTDAFEHNKERGQGPTSFRQLAKALPLGYETEKSKLNRQRRLDRFTEPRAVEVADALRVPRESLPPASKRLTVEALEEQVAEELEPISETVELNSKNLESLRVDLEAQRDALQVLDSFLDRKLGELESRVQRLEHG